MFLFEKVKAIKFDNFSQIFGVYGKIFKNKWNNKYNVYIINDFIKYLYFR